jgi:hypothetical protein
LKHKGKKNTRFSVDAGLYFRAMNRVHFVHVLQVAANMSKLLTHSALKGCNVSRIATAILVIR